MLNIIKTDYILSPNDITNASYNDYVKSIQRRFIGPNETYLKMPKPMYEKALKIIVSPKFKEYTSKLNRQQSARFYRLAVYLCLQDSVRQKSSYYQFLITRFERPKYDELSEKHPELTYDALTKMIH